MGELAFIYQSLDIRSITGYYAKPTNYTSVGVSVGMEAQSPIERQPVIVSPQSYIVHASSFVYYCTCPSGYQGPYCQNRDAHNQEHGCMHASCRIHAEISL